MRGEQPERRVIRLFPDYGRDWPLWESPLTAPDGRYCTDPEVYRLSVELTEELARWNAHWETHFDPFEGWDSEENRERWHRDGVRISSWLQREVAGFADVRYEPWPR